MANPCQKPIPYTIPYLISAIGFHGHKQRERGRVDRDQALLAHESTPTIVSWRLRTVRGEKSSFSHQWIMRLACAILLLVGARAAGVAPAETLASAVPAEKKNPIDAVEATYGRVKRRWRDYIRRGDRGSG